jgi:ABC-type multidrug transport system ATPase subunit
VAVLPTEVPAGPQTAPVAVAQQLGFAYGRHTALSQIDFSIAAGVTAIIGPNGSGKSTLLQLLAGLRQPTQGHLQVLGSTNLDDLRRRIAYLSDDAALFEELTGSENISLFAHIRSATISPESLAADLAIDRETLHKRVDSCSFGTRRKIAIAQTLVGRPDLLLLDEPTLGLDADARDRLGTQLRARANAGASIVSASNDLAFVEAIADQVLFLDSGRLVLSGVPGNLLAPLRAEASFEIETLAAFRPFDLVGFRTTPITEQRVSIQASAGPNELIRLVQALIQAGNEIRSIGVRQPDLSDVFRAVTGVEWRGSWPPE